MKKTWQKYHSFKKQLIELDSLYKQLKKRRKIVPPPEPTGNKSVDLYHHFSHYTNIIHIKLIHQLNLLISGINAQNPEAASMVRSCIETIGALAHMVRKINKKMTNHEEVWEILYVATMGQNTKTMSGKTTFSKAPQIFHSADYVREVNKLLNAQLTAIGSKNKDYILESYDFFSEFTHPNYLALEPYWGIIDGKMVYQKDIACMREDEVGQILLTITPLILVYEMVMRKAEKIEEHFFKLEKSK
ncbi:MAG: hypothetical protein HYU80_03040 [Candidatus Blackburnbacteria bacterium]|nr:hypothetical protein [Candidatus Blackburnbacteria bacterium]